MRWVEVMAAQRYRRVPQAIVLVVQLIDCTNINLGD